MTQLDEPLDLLRGPEWINRIALAPMTNQQSNADGSLREDEARWLEMRAHGGFGMVMTCASHVSPEGQCWPGQLGIWNDDLIPGLTRVASAMRDAGSRAIVQLHHGGRRANSDLTGLPVLAPFNDERTGARALSTTEAERIIGDYIAAARRAERAGFDGVEVHGAHGFLVGQFLDIGNIHRNDRFGGSFANRTNFLFDILERIRASTGPQFQVGLRLDPERGGIILSESTSVVAKVMASGLVDFIDMSMKDTFKLPDEEEHAGRPLLEYFTELPRGDVRLGVAGHVLSGPAAQKCLDRGVDFVLIGTAGVIHHDFAQRVLTDPTFVSSPKPVTVEHLRREGVGELFIRYLTDDWVNFVA
ncbi:NADH:flavin oxidoreductase [Rhodococcus sp. NPDC057135]|uniref:NADH:flavin oxidoreductase n=1 Tax=Rhodococcus sp. NPDC057135 TaxID=3346028 RepID=UPI003630EFDC